MVQEMATRELTVHLPDRVYQRLEHLAQETSQPLETLVLTSITGNLPPSLDDVPAELREDLRTLQTLDDDALWDIARSQLSSTQRAQLETLLARNSDGALTDVECKDLAAG